MTAQTGPRERNPFSALTVISLIVVAGIAAAALSVLSAYAPQLRSGNDGGGHALSKSAIGFAGIARLLPKLGRPVVVTRAPVQGGRGFALLVLTPTLASEPKRIIALTHGPPVLVVLPKWRVAPSPQRQGWVRRVDLAPAELVRNGLLTAHGSDGQVRRREGRGATPLFVIEDGGTLGRTGAIDNLQTISSRTLEPVVVDDAGQIVLGRFRGGRLYVLSDPDLINTQGVRDLETARAGVAIIDLAAGRKGAVAFDATLHGYARSRNLLRLILEPPFLGGTLCLLAAAILAGVQAAVRFGAPRPPARAIAFGKQALADSTAGLIHLAGREHRMGGRYAALARADAARAVGAPPNLSDADLDAFLDRLSDQAGLARFTALREEAARAGDVGELTNAARKIFQWRVEMTRERR